MWQRISPVSDPIPPGQANLAQPAPCCSYCHRPWRTTLTCWRSRRRQPRTPDVFTYEPDLHRRLADGTEWRVVKVMYEPDELNALLEAEGWRPQIDATRWFIHGSAAPG